MAKEDKLRIHLIVKSSVDNTIKYMFLTEDNLITEFSYIDKNDGKDIICVPTQTSCVVGCKFCHITDIAKKIKHRNLTAEEIAEGVIEIERDLKLNVDKPLLISYMGLGEPLHNIENVCQSMVTLINTTKKPIRFGLATSLPKTSLGDFTYLIDQVTKNKIKLKVHLSLHYTTDSLRWKWMPNAMSIDQSINVMNLYKTYTGNNVEIHYALIDGLNDTPFDVIRLTDLLMYCKIPVKFLFFNEKPTLNYHASAIEKTEVFRKVFDIVGIESEYYIPPGGEIGTSCGKFILEEYITKNKK